MRCPACGQMEDKVIESRSMANGDCIRRRRECTACHHRFTSYERIEEKPFMVVKRDGRREPFEREKLARGIERALEKRPVSTSFTEQIVVEIEDQAYNKGKVSREISTKELGELVLQTLNTVDKVAYIRFASVYKHFNDLEEFIKEVQNVGDNQDVSQEI